MDDPGEAGGGLYKRVPILASGEMHLFAWQWTGASKQSCRAETEAAAVGEDEVVDQFQFQCGSGPVEQARRLNVRTAGAGIAGGMIVEQDDSAAVLRQRFLDNGPQRQRNGIRFAFAHRHEVLHITVLVEIGCCQHFLRVARFWVGHGPRMSGFALEEQCKDAPVQSRLLKNGAGMDLVALRVCSWAEMDRKNAIG